MSHKVKFKFPAGVDLQCKITGYKGTVIARIELLSGSLQYNLQPKAEDNWIKDSYSVDEDSLEPVVIEGQDPKKHKAEEVEFEFRCGDKVKSRISGFMGIVVMAVHHINKCQQYTVQGMNLMDKDHKPVRHTMPTIELEKVDDGLNEKKESPKKEATKKRTGGATTRMSFRETIPTGRE